MTGQTQQTRSSEQPIPASDESHAAAVNNITHMLAREHAKPNPMTPSFCSPEESQIMKMIMGVNTECQRAWTQKALAPYQWKIVESLGEYDEDGDPGEHMLKSAVALLVFQWRLKADGEKEAILATLLGDESRIFKTTSKQCKVRLGT